MPKKKKITKKPPKEDAPEFKGGFKVNLERKLESGVKLWDVLS